MRSIVHRARRLARALMASLALVATALAATGLAATGLTAMGLAREAAAAGCAPVASLAPLTPAVSRAVLVPASWEAPPAAASAARGGASIGAAAGVEDRIAALVEPGAVRLTFLGHASFLIETPRGITAITDYAGYLGPAGPPLIATMNNAHGSHYTPAPDPLIRHVLRGWNPDGGWATHDVEEGDLRVRNIPTAVHGRYGRDELSNSIFVFETPDLCLAHLGHLHHLLTPEQVAELGQIDVLMVPIDGAYTMAQETMLEVIEQIRPAVVVPMHYFGAAVLARFTELAAPSWAIEASVSPTVTLARATLPQRTVLVLPGR